MDLTTVTDCKRNAVHKHDKHDFSTLNPQADERPEDLFQPLMAFVEDNLLNITGSIKHHIENLIEDE